MADMDKIRFFIGQVLMVAAIMPAFGATSHASTTLTSGILAPVSSRSNTAQTAAIESAAIPVSSFLKGRTSAATGKSGLSARQRIAQFFGKARLVRKLARAMRAGGFEFKWGGFLLGFFLGPLGVLLCLPQGRDMIFSSLIGMGSVIVLAISLLLILQPCLFLCP